MSKIMKKLLVPALMLAGASFATSAMATTCNDLPKYAELKAALQKVATGPTANAGFGMPVWVALINTKGQVCAVLNQVGSSADGIDITQEASLGHRIFAIHKANTSNAFSHSHIAIASASLYNAFQPGGALDSDATNIINNQLNPYAGDTTKFGTQTDPLVGKVVGGASGLGGGLALFNKDKKKVGAIGVSGDTVCTDHVIAWKIREMLAGGAYSGANVPFGVSAAHNDMMVQDIKPNPAGGAGLSAGSYGHATCVNNPKEAQAAGSIESIRILLALPNKFFLT
jgi:uncharacterized protein GlcG (DUF336 family)